MTTSDTPIAELFGSPAERPEHESDAPAAQPAKGRGSRTARAARASRPAREKRAAKAPAVDEIRLGDYPVARLLPPEIVEQGRVRTTRSIVIYLIIGVAVLAAAAVGGAYLVAQDAQRQLAAVQAQNASVLAQEAKYAPARTADSKVKLAQAAQRVGAAGEIDWTAYFGKIQAVLPQGVTITQISGETSTPAAPVTQDSAPLAQGRAAVVTVTVSAPDQASIANTLDRLQSLPGYAGAFPGAMTQGADASGSAASSPAPSAQPWSVPITLSLNADAFANRFAAKK